MSGHNIERELSDGPFGSSGKIIETPNGFLIGWGSAAPSNSTDIGFASGAIFIHTDGAADAQNYINEGTKTSSTWTAVGSVG